MKGAAESTFIHFRGKHDDWILFIDDANQYKEWKAQQHDALKQEQLEQQEQEEQEEQQEQQEQQVHSVGADAAVALAEDTSFVIPLFVIGKDAIFITHNRGKQGTKDSASKVEIANEFGTENRNVAIKQILLQGTLDEGKFPERQGSRNDSFGGSVFH